MDRKIERDVAPKRGQQNNISSGVFFVVVIVVVALILFLNIVYFYTPLLLLFFFFTLSVSVDIKWAILHPEARGPLLQPTVYRGGEQNREGGASEEHHIMTQRV